jgi:hypothetical protein
MLESTFRFDTEGQTVSKTDDHEVCSTEVIRVKVYRHGGESVHLTLYRVCNVLHPKGWRVGTTDVRIAEATFVGKALSVNLKGWVKTVDLCGASEEETNGVVHALLFAALANIPTFRDEVAQALPKWTEMLVQLWEREGPIVTVTLDWGGVWRSLTARPMCERPSLDDTRAFNLAEMERCREACLDAADMFADRIAKARQEQEDRGNGTKG